MMFVENAGYVCLKTLLDDALQLGLFSFRSAEFCTPFL